MEVYIEHTDGYSYTTFADNLKEAQLIVENEAIAVAENCSIEDASCVFPLYWSIKNIFKDIVASGYVNQYGEMYS